MTTKEKIIAAAREAFHKKGYAGARMQEIADLSGVNKALLHYHFQNKDVLFREVLIASFREFFPVVIGIIGSEMDLRTKIARTVEVYLDALIENPELPRFVLNELHNDPGFLKAQFKGANVPPARFMEQVAEAIRKGEIREVDPFQIIADIVGLCLIAILARPLITFVSGKTEKEYDLFLSDRKAHVTQVLLDGLFIKKSQSRSGKKWFLLAVTTP